MKEAIIKTIRAFSHEDTAELDERQLILLRNLCTLATEAGGFFLTDFSCLCTLLILIWKKIQVNTEINAGRFETIIVSLIYLSSRSPLCTVAYEEFKDYAITALADLYSCFIELLSAEKNIAVAAADALKDVSIRTFWMKDKRQIQKDTLLEYILSDNDIINKVILQLQQTSSQVEVEIITKIEKRKCWDTLYGTDKKEGPFANSIDFPVGDRFKAMITLMQEISSSPVICATFVINGGVEVLVRSLQIGEFIGLRNLQVIISILWNTIEYTKEITNGNDACSRLSTETGIDSLYRMLHHVCFCSSSFSTFEKTLRNDFVAIINLLSDNKKSHPHILNIDMLQLLTILAVLPESKDQIYDYLQYENIEEVRKLHNRFSQHFSMNNDDDIELKVMLWNLLSQFAKIHEFDIVGGSCLVEVLLSYLHIAQSDAEKSSKSKPQQLNGLKSTTLHMIQICALEVLPAFIPLCLAIFKHLNGISTILNFIKQCFDDSSSQQLLKAAIKLLSSIVVESPALLDDLSSLDAMPILLKIFCMCSDDSVRMNCMVVLSYMCKYRLSNQKIFFRLDSIAVLVDFLYSYSNSIEVIGSYQSKLKSSRYIIPGISTVYSSGTPYNRIMNSSTYLLGQVLSCLRNAIIGNTEMEISFFKHEGMDALLDVFQVSVYPLNKQIGSLIADFLLNEEAKIYAKLWRSDKNALTFTQLLMQFWSDEEKQAAYIQESCKYEVEKKKNPSLTSSFESPVTNADFCKTIFAIIHLMFPNTCSVHSDAKATQEAFCDLNMEESILMLTVLNYKRFLMGKAWADIYESLKVECIKPISADSLMLISNINHYNAIADNVKEQQESLNSKYLVKIIKDEKALLASILNQG